MKLSRDPAGRLTLVDAAGVRYEGVEPVRAFPIADPTHFVALCDGDGHEVAMIDNLSSCDAATRELVEAELAQREFVPVIRRILNTPPDGEPTRWEVETDRGQTTFQLENEDDVHYNGQGPVTIVDSHGIRYLIPDPRRLDAHSRRVLDRFF